MKYILGISAYYHDSAACLVKDGDILAAAQEERFSRKKHDASFPSKAVEYCLSEAGITIDQVSYISFYEKPEVKLGLGCLHVHSKRIPRNYKKLIQRLIKESGSKRGFIWRLGRPDLTVIAERVMTKVHKMMFFAKSEDVRFR